MDRPTILARIGDHRASYLEYEGPLSDARGHVKRVASGICFVEIVDPAEFVAVHFADPFVPTLNIKRGDGDLWLALPACT